MKKNEKVLEKLFFPAFGNIFVLVVAFSNLNLN